MAAAEAEQKPAEIAKGLGFRSIPSCGSTRGKAEARAASGASRTVDLEAASVAFMGRMGMLMFESCEFWALVELLITAEAS